MRMAATRREAGGSHTESTTYKGYRVDDPRGRKVGYVKEAYLNMSGEPEYLTVWIGFFGLRTVLLPVVNIAADEERRALTLR